MICSPRGPGACAKKRNARDPTRRHICPPRVVNAPCPHNLGTLAKLPSQHAQHIAIQHGSGHAIRWLPDSDTCRRWRSGYLMNYSKHHPCLYLYPGEGRILPVLVPLSRRTSRCHDADAGLEDRRQVGPFIKSMICGATRSLALAGMVAQGSPAASVAVLAIDAPPWNSRGGRVPAEVVAPDDPINEATRVRMRRSPPDHRPVRSSIIQSATAACPIRKVQDGRMSSTLVMQVVGTFAWLLVGAMAHPGAAREPVPPPRRHPSPTSSSAEETAQPPVQPVDLSTWSGRTEVSVQSGDPGIDLRQARSGHLAAAAVLDALQRRLARALGAIAQRLGRRPRQGWINAADGNMYRLWFFTFAQAFNQGPKGNAYLGAYTIFLPFSRRLDLIVECPVCGPQQRWQRVAHHQPDRADAAVEEPHDIRRYLVHAPRLAARDAGLLAHGRDGGAGPDRQPAPCGEDRPGPGRPPSGTISRAVGWSGAGSVTTSRSAAVGLTL